MRRLPRTNFDETLSLIYENMLELGEKNAEDFSDAEEEFLDIIQTAGVMHIDDFFEMGAEILGLPSQDDIVDRISDKFGLDLEIIGDEVLLVDNRGFGEENAEDAEDYGNTFPGASDVKIPWKQTPNQKKWSELHHRLKALANSYRPDKREEELKIIAQLQHIVDTDPKFKNEYVSKPML